MREIKILFCIIALFTYPCVIGQINSDVLEPGQMAADHTLTLSGKVTHEGEQISTTTVNIYEHNNMVYSFSTDNGGDFEVYMNAGTYYTMEVTSEGYLTKRVAIDTRGMPLMRYIGTTGEHLSACLTRRLASADR